MIPLSSWIKRADDAHNASKYLNVNPQFGFAVPMFLLHWSIELYLKAFLLNSNIQPKKIHELVNLYQKCGEIDDTFINFWICDNSVCTKQQYWINYIDVFGAEDGGVRYINKKRTSFGYPMNIHSYFEDLIEYIKKNIDMNKDITNYC